MCGPRFFTLCKVIKKLRKIQNPIVVEIQSKEAKYPNFFSKFITENIEGCEVWSMRKK